MVDMDAACTLTREGANRCAYVARVGHENGEIAHAHFFDLIDSTMQIPHLT